MLAALILLLVGIWMHGKAQADEWQRYIRDKMSDAVAGGSAWFLFLLAFIAVYREVFETILFYAALWRRRMAAALVAGALSGVAMLAMIALAMLRFSRPLPITEFFCYSATLIAILTVVLAGKGVAALQEAGPDRRDAGRRVPRISMLGLFPTLQVVARPDRHARRLIVGFRPEPAARRIRLAAA